MSLSDPIGDMIARIKNAQMRNHKKVEIPSSRFKTNIADVLKEEGFIIDYKVNMENNKPLLLINLKYNSGNPVISSIQRVSKPGRRVYSSVSGMNLVKNGLGISILSTPKGVMSDRSARTNNVGGEILCVVF